MDVDAATGGRRQPSDKCAVDRRKPNKTCRVCADRAYGHNFNAVACESCKAFFRRNALRLAELRCAFAGRCDVSPLSRRFCQKCRMAKCLAVGMRPDMILTEDRLAKKREQYSNSKKAKAAGAVGDEPPPADVPLERRASSGDDPNANSASVCSGGESGNTTGSDKCVAQPSPRSLGSSTGGQSGASLPALADRGCCTPPTHAVKVEPLALAAEQCACACRCGALPAGSTLGEALGALLAQRLDLQSTTAGGERGAQSVAECMRQVAQPPPPPALATDFSQAHGNGAQAAGDGGDAAVVTAGGECDAALIDELLSAASHMQEPVEGPGAGHPLVPVFAMMDVAIRRLVEMCKKIGAFTQLCHDDQTALLKGGCTEMMILRGVMSYEPSPQPAWRARQRDAEHNVYIALEPVKAYDARIYDEHLGFLSTWDPSWRTDEPLMLLLTAVTLFEPQRHNVKRVQQINAFRDMYLAATKRYVCGRYPDKVYADYVYESLVHKLKQLRRLNANAVNLFANFEPKDVGQLLVEIFDLRA